MDRFLNLLWLVFVIAASYTLVSWRYNEGPVIWLRKIRGRNEAQEDGRSRRELVERVRQLLPQAGNGNVVFSLQAESRTSGGSKVQVTTHTYHTKVFVADTDCLWIVPFYYDAKARDYQLGKPIPLTRDLLQHVSLSGTSGKKLEVTFRLKPEVGLDKVVMVLEPLQFKRNRFYPFNFLQEEACEKALALTTRMAYFGCGQSADDLEDSRAEDVCLKYATAAGLLGFCGVAAASVSGSLVLTLAFFAGALVMFVLMFGRKHPPKISVVFVVLEALMAYWLFNL